ncbi:sugar kinase [Aliiglaciecola sp. 3_MG-2023]|uniref:sugar kinase n=1 Tax=Aliiglaciecola sp. 3_MG-2023 TaxID=3062644 RepID=UPI0034A16ACD
MMQKSTNSNIHSAKPIVMIGECMMELSQYDHDKFYKSFAGDTYNSSVYMKRAFEHLDVNFMSCIGNDAVSTQLIDTLQLEGLANRFIEVDSKRIMGTYMVQTDDQGERSFLYWRSDSAAKQLMKNLSADAEQALEDSQLIFFSGITLAILDEQDRARLLHLLGRLRNKGVNIAFDPNYRPALWESPKVAKNRIGQGFQVANILLPGIEDFELFELRQREQIIKFLRTCGFDELVIKDGANSIFGYSNEALCEVQVTPNPEVIDSTSAGDAFAGVYLGARIAGLNIKSAIEHAAAVAKEVTNHRGAIMPQDKFNCFWKAYQAA